ncbi:Gfo/Idh/MocA family oxidoreductase [Bifidobacterium sp. ESL0732]|uniref:Gfo/Idh/MocA family protein n=1 Tax=Bifidobacterium sp. ESL0732 TaxID=2983222 RepID=UPI0023F99183|nr:Gfo/Idh/MocA family oxidoreductase [Bifidobacterium sp. ESL0732]WEV63941.1 Gfo/Idh/MocA family oxidoreductase [Bifidobacterium sp. ESL0732]
MLKTQDEPVRIGILGAGTIAHKMARTIGMMRDDERYAGEVELCAIAARDLGRAQQFARKFNIPQAYGSYEELVNDPSIDLVYIATPHSFHAQQATLCLNAGRNVLVEKPFAPNAAQARDVFSLAERKGLFCGEAFWTRFMPMRETIASLIDSGIIGEISAVTASIGGYGLNIPRLVKPELAGGALLDTGIYTLSFADTILEQQAPRDDGNRQTPQQSDFQHGSQPIAKIQTSMRPCPTGVDAQSFTTLTYENGAMAEVFSSIIATTQPRGNICGSKGSIICDNVMDIASADIYDENHHLLRTVSAPVQLTGYEYEVEAAAQAVRTHKTEYDRHQHSDTLRILGLMDQIRADWGLRYPFE